MTAVTPRSDARIEEDRQRLRARNGMVAQVRGVPGGADLPGHQLRAIAEFCLAHGLTPLQHIGLNSDGSMYPRAELYEERGAPLIRDNIVRVHEPQYIHEDDRLADMTECNVPELAARAKAEMYERMWLRVRWGVPESAKAACLYRIEIVATGQILIGVNWAADGEVDDPIGDRRPVQTATTRAARRAWKQVADILPVLSSLKAIETGVDAINEGLPEVAPPSAAPRGPAPLTPVADEFTIPSPSAERLLPRGTIPDPYGDQAPSVTVSAPGLAEAAPVGDSPATPLTSAP